MNRSSFRIDSQTTRLDNLNNYFSVGIINWNNNNNNRLHYWTLLHTRLKSAPWCRNVLLAIVNNIINEYYLNPFTSSVQVDMNAM